MTMRVAEVAHKLEVEKSLIKTWTLHFKEYLSEGANPAKGTPRRFTIEDIRVLAYVYMYYWEDNPDYEDIKGRFKCSLPL
jgi:hypothetical protein